MEDDLPLDSAKPRPRPARKRRNCLRSTLGRRTILWTAFGVFWIAASGSGLVMLAMHANSPRPSQGAPPQWPSDARIELSERGATLLLFAHPRCPCTRASLGELEKIVARFQGAVTPRVVFFKPLGSQAGWDQTDLRKTAAAIPGVDIVSDPGGVEASRFNAETSGETFLYSDRGELLFQGGITAARGHAGDNDGRSAIESSLEDAAPACRQTPVFGCSIAASPDQNQAGAR